MPYFSSYLSSRLRFLILVRSFVATVEKSCRIMFVVLGFLILLVQKSLCKVCYLGGDVALVLDISPSANNVQMEDVRLFAKQLVSLLDDHERSQLCLVTVREEPLVRFTFDDWSIEDARGRFLEVFRVLKSKGNRTHHAMKLLTDRVFTREYGARDNVEDIAILLTDRRSSDVVQADIRANKLKATGAIVVVVAIGDAVGEKYASTSNFFIRVEDFDELPVAYNILRNQVFDCSPCPEGWLKKEDGFCYMMVKIPLAWDVAEANCEAMENGAHLTIFDTPQQVGWFANEYSDKWGTGVWIGLSRNDTISPFTYLGIRNLDTTIVTWKSGYPKNKLCVQYNSDGMVDDDCDVTKQSVCEMEQLSDRALGLLGKLEK